MTTDLAMLLGLLALIALAAVLGAAEAALLRVPRVRIDVGAAAGERGATRVVPLLDDLPGVMNTILLVVLLVQIAAATLAAALASRYFGNLGITITSIVLTIVLFVYAESIPKTFAIQHPERLAEVTAPLVRALAVVLRPFVSALVWLADLQAPGSGIASPTAVSEQELVRLAADAAEVGRIEDSDLDLIERTFALGDLQVDQILVPRTDVVGIPADATAGAALQIATESGHRRLPLYDGDLDSITGVVHLRDLASLAVEDPERPASAAARPELIVPETRRVIDLLTDMQSSETHFAVVVDEHGGTAGIVTIEDVVSELVGDIAEPPHAEPTIFRIGRHRWQADAALEVDELEAETGAEMPSGDWRTISGLVVAAAGRIPERGDVIEVGGLSFEVLNARPQQVLSVRIWATRP
jgi:CBS domain containing-hemolysin-like protein